MNLSYTASAPDRETADFTAARFAKYGINAVRMHKFSYPTGQMGIGDPNDSTRMDPKGLDRLDYFVSKLKEHGVYFGWSHTYGFHVVPGDRKRLLAYDEIAKNLKGNTYAFIHFAEDVQDLMIEMVVNLLKHKNPYTGRTYAEEPALCFIELQNEDDIFFYTSEKAFNACPTYKKRFLDPVRGLAEGALRFAGEACRRPGETPCGQVRRWRTRNIVPQLNPWFFGDDHLPGQKGGARRRLLDTASFLHDVQDRFYSRFVKAIRDAGYRGPLNGSPWQAPSMLPHYYNLYSDYKVGYIDRHNYFDGTGPDMFASMLSRAGQRLFQQRPAASAGSAVRPVGVDSRLSERLRGGRAGHRGGLRHGPARLGRLLRVPVAGQPPGLRRHRRRVSLGRLGGGRAHVAGPVPRPGPNDLPRRRQGGGRHLGSPGQSGRPGRGPLLLLRQGGAARRREILRRQRAAGSPGRGACRRRVHRQVRSRRGCRT